jgi:exopolysaccharide production protein ExoY
MLFAGQHDNVGLPSVRATPLEPVGGGVKRALDIVVALGALILLLPLLLTVALLVVVSIGRPILCRQTRIGFGGRPIGCYRFRTTQTLGGNAPPTPLGVLLAQSGIDKLPQLINVLKGEMSCVGPRPVGADELPQGSEVGPYLSARPGMTGTWQLGPYAPSRDEAAALDSAYIHNWSMQGDLIILLKTIPAVVRVDGSPRGHPMS